MSSTPMTDDRSRPLEVRRLSPHKWVVSARPLRDAPEPELIATIEGRHNSFEVARLDRPDEKTTFESLKAAVASLREN